MAQITLNSDHPSYGYDSNLFGTSLSGRAREEAERRYLQTGDAGPGFSVNTDAPIEPNFGDQGASYTRSMIHRDQWEDYLNRFRPYEEKLIDMYGSKDLDQQMSRNLGAVDSAFKNTMQSASDKRKLYNTNMTRRQFDQYAKKMSMNKGTATVHATNMTRLARKDRNMELLAGASTPVQTVIPEAQSE